MIRAARNGAIGLGIMLLTGLMILVVTHEGRVAIQTALLITEVLPDATWRPLPSMTATPLVEEADYAFAGGRGRGQVFRPSDGNRHGAMVFFLGINPDLQDATLHRMAEALARQGVVVLLARPVDLAQGRVTHQEVENLIGAFRFLRNEPYVDQKRVGYAGFCVGSSLSLVAAADPRISSDVRFVNFFGGYYSVPELVAAMTSRQMELNGTLLPWEPNDDAMKWASQQLVQGLSDREAQLVLDLGRGGRQGAPGAENLAELSPAAASVYRVLANRDYSQALALYERLPDDLKAQFAGVSPSSSLDWLQAKLFVMHDRNDSYVPYAESERLMASLAEYPRKHYTRFDIFQHMHPSRAMEPLAFAKEVGKLFYHLYLVMLEVA